MQQKILEIIEFLISEINNYQDIHLSDIDKISEKLLDRGYTEMDIQRAVEWIVEFINNPAAGKRPQKLREVTSKNIRILNEFERAFFTREAYGYLIQLQALKMMNATQIENVIDRCMMMGLERVKLDELQNVVMQVMSGLESEDSKLQTLFYNSTDSIH